MDNTWLAKIYKHHSKWVSIAKTLCSCKIAEDAVQEMYLNLAKWGKPENAIKNDTVNEDYVFITLRNTVWNMAKKEAKRPTPVGDYTEVLQTSNNEYSFFHEYPTKEEILALIKANKSENQFYYQKIYELHLVEGMSLRSIAKGSGIGKETICRDAKSVKQVIKDNISELILR